MFVNNSGADDPAAIKVAPETIIGFIGEFKTKKVNK